MVERVFCTNLAAPPCCERLSQIHGLDTVVCSELGEWLVQLHTEALLEANTEFQGLSTGKHQ